MSNEAKRPDLNRILHDYQVKDDPNGIDYYSPYFGLFGSSKNKITHTEARMLNDVLNISGGPEKIDRIKDIIVQADKLSRERYPEGKQDDGHRDALRHITLGFLLTQECGEAWTKRFLTAHEGTPNNRAAREAMDLYNNQLGWELYEKRGLSMTPQQAVEAADALIRHGDAIVIDGKGKLAWSDQVPVYQTGIADPNDRLPGKIDASGSSIDPSLRSQQIPSFDTMSVSQAQTMAVASSERSLLSVIEPTPKQADKQDAGRILANLNITDADRKQFKLEGQEQFQAALAAKLPEPKSIEQHSDSRNTGISLTEHKTATRSL